MPKRRCRPAKVCSFTNDGSHGPVTAAEIVERAKKWGRLMPRGLWRVCWAGDTEDYGFSAHYGQPVQKEEAQRRMELGMKKFPHLIYWLEIVRMRAFYVA